MWCVQETKVLPLQAPLIQPFRTALGDHKTLDNVLFALTIDGKITGYGEAAVATHITGETMAQTLKNLNAAACWLKGQDIRHYLPISNGLHERWGKNPAMIAAVETALMDALTRSLKIPLWKMFGTKCHVLKTDITIVIADLPETQATVKRFYRQGFRQFKVKIGRDFDLDLQRVKAVQQLAPKGAIYLDANQGFTALQMLKFLRAIAKQGIRPALLEQPVPREDYDGLMKVSRSTDIPVCADESVRSLAEAVRIIKDKAAAVINIKLMKFGLVQAAEIARLAQASGTGLMVGGMMESALAMTTSAHLAAGLGGCSYVDLDTPFFIKGEAERCEHLSKSGVYDLRGVNSGIGVIPSK